jgi:hypothetical protein
MTIYDKSHEERRYTAKRDNSFPNKEIESIKY